MAERVAAERVAAEQHDVDGEHERADADAERFLPVAGSVEPHRLPHVLREHEQEQQREVQEVAMDVLQDQRERVLAEVRLRGSPTAHDGGSAQNAL